MLGYGVYSYPDSWALTEHVYNINYTIAEAKFVQIWFTTPTILVFLRTTL